jgi:hypothetical protein
MKRIEVSDESYRAIELAANMGNTTHAAVIAELLDRATRPAAGGLQPDPDSDDRAIFKVYKGQRTDGILTPSTGRVIITTGPLAGQSFDSPSGAARAVIVNQTGNQAATNNGWKEFWVLDDGTRRKIQAVRPAHL